jgi:MOSC domain-containing protein YiiM
MGRTIQINISRGGVPKRPIPEGVITPLGLEGDSWAHPETHGGARQAVLLIAAETVDELVARGYPLYHGALGENLTTRGLDRRQLRIGQTLRAGRYVASLLFEVKATEFWSLASAGTLKQGQCRQGTGAGQR